MIVLKATQQQFKALNGYKNGNSVLQFTTDASNNYIVGKSVITDPAFEAIRGQLEQLEEIEFEPRKDEINI